MANVASRGYTFGTTELVTNAKLHALVDNATIVVDTISGGLPVKATGAEVTTGTDDDKFATPKAIKDAGIIATPVKATGAEIDTGTDDSKFATAKAIADSGLVSETAWADYSSTSTIVGWSSFSVKKIYTKKVGSVVFVQYSIVGTSDSTTTTFTVPYAAASGCLDGAYDMALCAAIDNSGSWSPTRTNMSSSTVSPKKDLAGNAFTGSGTKYCTGQFWYATA